MGEIVDFYLVATVTRIICSLGVACLFLPKDSGPTLRAVAVFFLAYGLSLCVFFTRQFLPPEWADLIRDVGVGFQALSLIALSFFLWRKFK